MAHHPATSNPPHYLLIGNGRLASHLTHYFALLGLPHKQWSRQSAVPLSSLARECDRILLLIKDDQIDNFISDHPELHQKQIIHCSGALASPYAICAHPLASFSQTLYDLSFYQSIPFIIDKGSPSLDELLPGLPNPSHVIEPHLRPLYHALCVMSGNFSTILWQKFFTELQAKFGLSKELTTPYLQSITHNLQHAASCTLTGPLARNDKQTIASNLAALQDDPFADIYRAFVRAFTESSQ